MAYLSHLIAAALLLPFATALPPKTPIQSSISLEPSTKASTEPPVHSHSFIGPPVGRPYNILQTNIDGWADSNIRAFFHELNDAGYNNIISAPANNQTLIPVLDTVFTQYDPLKVVDGCQYQSCPINSTGTGLNVTQPRFNYYNGPMVSAMQYGVDILGPRWFDGKPDIVLSGPEQGNNSCVTAFHWPMAAARKAAGILGIPAISFNGQTGTIGNDTAWNASVTLHRHSKLYAELATIITHRILWSGTPYLPANTFLNVNFPLLREGCNSVEDFKFVLSRIHHGFFWIPKDVKTCGRDRLPMDCDLLRSEDCYVSISLIKADKQRMGSTADKEQQANVLERLGSILSCPEAGDWNSLDPN